MKSAVLILSATERATFSLRPATLGPGLTRLHPMGSALWGFAAAQGRYGQWKKGLAFEIFHSGKVRFSDAYPVTKAGRIAWPTPEILVRAKGEKCLIENRLDATKAWVGRAAFYNDREDDQAEAIGRPFIAADLDMPEMRTGARLRTSTENGRARPGALFAMEHIPPTEAPRYAVCIECDADQAWKDIEKVWTDLLAPFRTGDLIQLGRARRTNAGGWYHCEESGESAPFWPDVQDVRSDSDKIRVWLLSDLIAPDQQGEAPPRPQLFGLPEGWRFDERESAYGFRRWAPWNAHLNARDVERMAIKAGAILTYCQPDGGEPLDVGALKASVGLWREHGLGRVWIDPPMLRESRPAASAARFEAPALSSQEPGSCCDEPESASPLVKWAKDKAALSNVGERDAFLNDLRSDYATLRRKLGADGPSVSQWRAVASAALTSGDLATLKGRLFGETNPVCGAHRQATRKDDWLKDIRVRNETVTPRSWLQAQLSREAAAAMPYAHVRWAVDAFVKEAARERRRAQEGRDD